MDKRQRELIELKEYIEKVDKETTLLLQNLQWDHKHLIESPAMVSCKHVADHRIPVHSKEAHEKQCYLTQQGYTKDDIFLPDPVNPNPDTVVKLSKEDIMKILNAAAASDPTFKKGVGSGGRGCEPLSAARLQLVYSADERRAIHDAVVAAAPAGTHDLADLALPSASGAGTGAAAGSQAKSRAEVLAELRDMKRRRARYRVAAKSAHYSDLLRDLIKTQMELYAEARGIIIKTEYGPKSYVSIRDQSTRNDQYLSNTVVIKQERISPDTDNNAEGSRRYREERRSRSRDRSRRTAREGRDASSDNKRRRYGREDSSAETRRYEDITRDKYSKERRQFDGGPSKRDEYYKTKDVITNNFRHDDNKSGESSSRRDWEKYGDRSKHSKHNYRNNDDSSKTSKNDYSSTKYGKHTKYKEKSSKDSNYDYRGKHGEVERQKHSDRSREEKQRRRSDVHIKEEKTDYEDCNDDRRKRKRHS